MHASFKLQGYSFVNYNELLTFAETLSDELFVFLSEWFNPNTYITVNTSGSTGTPKPIELKKEFVKNSAKATGAFFNLSATTKALCCLSTQYIAGKMMVIRALELGWELDYIETTSNPLENIYTKYDFCAMVPMQVKASLWDLHMVKTLIIGGGVVSPNLLNQLQQVKTQCFATYGMTETITHIAVKALNNTKDQDKEYLTLPNISISQDDRKCLIIHAPKLSEKLIITNDIVEIKNSKSFKWLGRHDNVINSGGIKIHPEQLENSLASLISDRFFFIGIPDNTLGEKLILIVEGENRTLDFTTLKLNKYQTPKKVYFVEKFIETETKKIQRKKTLDLIDLFK